MRVIRQFRNIIRYNLRIETDISGTAIKRKYFKLILRVLDVKALMIAIRAFYDFSSFWILCSYYFLKFSV